MYEGIFFAGLQICYRKTIIPAAAGVWARLSLFHCFLFALHIIISPPCFFSFQSSINHTGITANYHALAPSFPRSQVFIPGLRRLRLTLSHRLTGTGLIRICSENNGGGYFGEMCLKMNLKETNGRVYKIKHEIGN